MLVLKQLDLHRSAAFELTRDSQQAPPHTLPFPQHQGARTDIDFYLIENLLAARAWQKSSLSMSPDMLELLEQLHRQLPSPTLVEHWDWLKRMFQTSLGHQRGSELSALLASYANFASEYENLQNDLRTNRPADEQLLVLRKYLPALRELQQRYFGVANAKILFAESNQRQTYLIQRRIVSLDSSLSDELRQLQLQQLLQQQQEQQQEQQAELDAGSRGPS